MHFTYWPLNIANESQPLRAPVDTQRLLSMVFWSFATCTCASLYHFCGCYAALYKLLENAVGTDHALFRATHGFACGVQSYTDSHLRLLRQEQLILLAENERLQAQVRSR